MLTNIKYYIFTFFAILLSLASSAQEIIDYADFFKQREYPKSLLYMKIGYEHTQINGSIFNTEMAGIYSTCVVPDTLDESPMAYKSMDEIVENIEPTAEIICRIKPIYNFKAAE